MMENYETLEGHRKGSLVYGYETHVLRQRSKWRAILLVKYKDGCPARAKLHLELNEFSVIKEHENHLSTERDIEIRIIVYGKKKDYVHIFTPLYTYFYTICEF